MNSKIFCKRKDNLIQGHSTEPYYHRSEESTKSTEAVQDNILWFIHFTCFGKALEYC